MISREEALKFLNEKITNQNIIKHMLATEAIMGGIYDYLSNKGADLAGSREEWMIAGLLHDGDYSEEVPVEKQGIQIARWLREKGYEIPENIAYTMAAHNWHNNGVEPKSKMDWALFCADTLTGLIVATALVMPGKKLTSVTVESILKKFKNFSFAAGIRRDDIAMCQEKLGIPLEEFIPPLRKPRLSMGEDEAGKEEAEPSKETLPFHGRRGFIKIGLESMQKISNDLGL